MKDTLTFDPSDVATVLGLEEPAKALLKAIKAAKPAIDRLCKANYPGAGWGATTLMTANPGASSPRPGSSPEP